MLPQSYQYPNLSEGADRVGGQLRGDKECPFRGVTKSGRVWRKVPESGARSVDVTVTEAAKKLFTRNTMSDCDPVTLSLKRSTVGGTHAHMIYTSLRSTDHTRKRPSFSFFLSRMSAREFLISDLN